MIETPDPKLTGSLLALLAHDLRNPLSALQSNLGYLESFCDAKELEAREALTDVAASCSSIRHIIDNLELLGMLMQGGTRTRMPERGTVGLQGLVTETIARFEPVAQSYGARVVLTGDHPANLNVSAHREMLSRALGNLLFNSIQHGGTSAEVSVSISASATQGAITCADSGPPLAGHLRAQAFTAEGQLSSKNDTLGRYSRGLGLFSATIAAELAGATVHVLEPVDGTSRFEIRAELAG